MPALSIIVLSDLHAGEKNPFSELRIGSEPVSIDCTHRTADALVGAILDVVDKTPPERRALVCAGDVTARSHSKEFESAGKFLEQLAGALEIPGNQRFLVPGNHDVDWKLTDLGSTFDGWYLMLRQRKFEKIMSTSAPSFAFCSAGRPRRLDLPGGAHLFLLDSPWDDQSTTVPHHGRLGGKQIDELKRLLAEAGPTSTKVVLLHHHVTPHGRAHDDPDFSLLQDAGELNDVLRDAGVQFVIHGHQHRFSFQQVGPAPRALGVLCSGSATLDYEHLPKQVPNSFHVVTFDDVRGDRTCGEVHTRVFMLADGWIRPHRTQHRLGARVPFGHTPTNEEVEEWSSELLSRCDAAGFVRVDPFLSSQANGRYYNPDEFMRLFRIHLEAVGLNGRYDIHFNYERDCWQVETP